MIIIEPPSTMSNPALPASNLTRILILVCFLLVASLPVAAQKSIPTNWQLTWSDEFNGPDGSPPDPAKWNIVTGGKGFGNNELAPPTCTSKTGI
jgi:hypothetical protein